jgi:hypothetical protein
LTGTSNLAFLPSWQLRQVALSRDTGAAGATVAAKTGALAHAPKSQIRPLIHREDVFGILQNPKNNKKGCCISQQPIGQDINPMCI